MPKVNFWYGDLEYKVLENLLEQAKFQVIIDSPSCIETFW